jgi:hypothetical protein
MKRIAQSYLTIVIVGVAWLVLHGWWWITCPGQRGENASGFGAFLTVLGVWIALLPYIRLGIQGMAEERVKTGSLGAWHDTQTITDNKTIHEEKVKAAMPSVYEERIVAIFMIVIGSLLNGYGTPLVRWLGLSA